MLASVNSNLPRVTYLKSIDYFVLACFGFIFLTSIEYVVAIRFSRSRREAKMNQKMILEELSGEEKPLMTVQVHQGGKTLSFKPYQEKPPSYECNGHSGNGQSKPTLVRADSAKSSSLLYSHVVKPRKNGRKLSTSLRNRASPLHRIATKVSTHENIIDMASRILFPLAYLIFNVVYWIHFFQL